MAKQYTDEEILAYNDKATTAVQERYADWLIEKLAIEFPNTKAEGAFREAVRVATALRSIFQASPENQEAREESRAERAEEKAEKPKATKATRGKAAKAEPDEDEAPPAKAKPAKRSAKAAKPVANEDEEDTAVAPAPRKSAPRKASARSGAAAPF